MIVLLPHISKMIISMPCSAELLPSPPSLSAAMTCSFPPSCLRSSWGEKLRRVFPWDHTSSLPSPRRLCRRVVGCWGSNPWEIPLPSLPTLRTAWACLKVELFLSNLRCCACAYPPPRPRTIALATYRIFLWIWKSFALYLIIDVKLVII